MLKALILLLTLCTLNAWADPSEGLSFVLSSQRLNRYGGHIMMDAGELTTDQIPGLLESFGTGPTLPDPSRPIDVVVVVPKNAPAAYREKFLNEISTAIRARYPQAAFRLSESFVDIEADAATLIEQKAALANLAKRFAEGTPPREMLLNAEHEADEGLRSDQELCVSWFGADCARRYRFFNSAWAALVHPYNTVIAARGVAMTKFGITATVTLTKYGINPASLAIAAAQGMTTAMFGYNAKKWSEFCTSHTFPFFKDSLPVGWYNENGWFKSASINFLRSMGLNYIFRMAAHLSGQKINGEAVATANSAEFFVSGLGIALPEIWLDGLMDDGLRALELKGVVNDPARKYLLWGISFIDTAMHASFRAGDLRLAYSFAAASWIAKGSTWAASKLMRARTERFVAISNYVGDRTEGRTVAAKNILAFVLGGGLGDAISNRVRERFTVGDRTLVEQNLGLEEMWNLDIASADMERVRRDPTLSPKELRKILGLRDVKKEILNGLMAYRQTHLGQEFSLPEMCADALTKSAPVR